MSDAIAKNNQPDWCVLMHMSKATVWKDVTNITVSDCKLSGNNRVPVLDMVWTAKMW